MGIHTTYVGHVTIEPRLSVREVAIVRDLNQTRRWDAPGGALRVAPYPVDDEPPRAGLDARNRPAPGAPGLWCPWTACDRGHCLHWDGREKPYDGAAWLRWTIDTLLRPGADVTGSAFAREHGLTCDHTLDGMIIGERADTMTLVVFGVADNEVRTAVLLPGVPEVQEWPPR